MFLRMITLISISALLPRSLFAQEMSVPVGVQHTVLMKVLAYNRSLQARMGNEIVIGVLYQSKFRSSLRAKEEFIKAGRISSSSMEGRTFEYVATEVSEITDLRTFLDKNKVDILYVAPLRAIDIETIASASRSQGVLTLTGVPNFVESGLAVGVALKGDQAQIEINLAAAKAEGADFTSQLLKVVRIIQ